MNHACTYTYTHTHIHTHTSESRSVASLFEIERSEAKEALSSSVQWSYAEKNTVGVPARANGQTGTGLPVNGKTGTGKSVNGRNGMPAKGKLGTGQPVEEMGIAEYVKRYSGNGSDDPKVPENRVSGIESAESESLDAIIRGKKSSA